MSQFIKAFCLFVILFYNLPTVAANENQPIRAAVGENFINGLHAKYLRYLADKLSLDITISAMPFARRIREIQKGHLDIIVGIQHTEDRDDEFVYIEPFYEVLSYRFYTLTANSNKIVSYEDLYEKNIGVNRHARYFEQFDRDEKLRKIEVTNLKQNIELLLHGRTDVFLHYSESTQPTLVAMGVDNLVVQTQYQPEHNIQHFIAIAKSSALMARKNELQQIVQQAIINKDFLKIRLEHYASKK